MLLCRCEWKLDGIVVTAPSSAFFPALRWLTRSEPRLHLLPMTRLLPEAVTTDMLTLAERLLGVSETLRLRDRVATQQTQLRAQAQAELESALADGSEAGLEAALERAQAAEGPASMLVEAQAELRTVRDRKCRVRLDIASAMDANDFVALDGALERAFELGSEGHDIDTAVDLHVRLGPLCSKLAAAAGCEERTECSQRIHEVNQHCQLWLQQ